MEPAVRKRWVNRGARGIAVFDRERPTRLRYYFDVADTHETRTSRPVPLWTVREEYVRWTSWKLWKTALGSWSTGRILGDALLSAARNAVEDNLGDYLAELGQLTQGSLLEELDGDSLGLQFRTVAGNSVAAMLLARCGVDPAGYLGDEDFRDDWELQHPGNPQRPGGGHPGHRPDVPGRDRPDSALPLERQAEKEIRTVADSPTNGIC